MIHFKIGTFDCIAINDGTAWYKARSFFCNAPEDEFNAALADYAVHEGKLLTPFHCLLVQTGDQTVLIDTGLGPEHSSEAGHLITHLLQAGIAPDTVDVVVLSHAHGDHAGGAITAAGDPAFPRARYILSEPEWTFWQAAPEKPGSVPEILAKLASQIDLISPDAAILPGITAIPAPGHTPGQIALLLESAGERIIYIADVIAHPLHALHPTWNIIADVDPEQAIRTRRKLLDWAVADYIPIYSYHYADPGPYHVEAEGSKWTPKARES